jgi:hypothetical protein
MHMAKAKVSKVVKGYVVKRETIVKDEETGAQRRVRKEVSRLYHALSAAETCLAMCRKQWPDGDFYIHEKTGADGLTHQPIT